LKYPIATALITPSVALCRAAFFARKFMRMDKLTSRLQQALADAQSLAIGRDHNMIEPIHVMLALLDLSTPERFCSSVPE